MYKCYDCYKEFEEPIKVSEDKTPGGVFEGGSFIHTYDASPCCQASFGEAIECDSCGEFYFREDLIPVEGEYLCQFCYDDMESDFDEQE